MSFQFSSEGSNISLRSDVVSESTFKTHNSTLGLTGAKILNNSFPMISKKQEIKKDNETYAYLEKVKQLDISKNNIEHVHYLRHLEYGDISFTNHNINPLMEYSNALVREVRYKPEPQTLRSIVPINPPEYTLECRVTFQTVNDRAERYGILISKGLVLTLHKISKTDVKKYKILNLRNQRMPIDNVGPYIEGDNFTILPVYNTETAPGSICTAFKLSIMDKVQILESRTDLKVVNIAEKYFAFSCVGLLDIKVGCPIFSSKWELQGIFSHSVLDLYFALRFEPILAYLIRHRHNIDSPVINEFLVPYTSINF